MAFSGLGAGIEGDPYQITTWTQFQEIANDLDKHFILMNDIDANFNYFYAGSLTFTGILDGNNFSLLNLRYSTSSNYPGLFLCTGSSVKKLKIYFYTNLNYCIFSGGSDTAGCSNAIFDNIDIYNVGNDSAYQGIGFSKYINNCTFNNIKIFSKGTLIFSRNISNSIFTDILIQSFTLINFGNHSSYEFLSNTLTRCKFIVQNKGKEVILIYKPVLSTFNDCLFFGGVKFSGYSTTGRNYFNRSSFIANVDILRTGNIGINYPIYIGYINGEFSECYFGGQIKIDHRAWTLGNYPGYKFTYVNNNDKLINCHLDYKFLTTWDTPPTGVPHVIAPNVAVPEKTFIDVQVTGFTDQGSNVKDGTDVFINSEKIIPDLTKTGNYGLLTTDQTKISSNFTNFDFVDVWEINEGVTPPKLRNAIYDVSPYLADQLLNSIFVTSELGSVGKLSLNTYKSIPPGGSLKVYLSKIPENIESVQNLVNTTVIDNYLIEADLILEEGLFYVLAVYEKDEYREDLSDSAYHYSVDQVETTIINIVSPNHLKLDTPRLSNLHGATFFNGFIYGSSRGGWDGVSSGVSLIKLNPENYTDFITNTCYSNKTESTDQLIFLDQIVSFRGFLWCLSNGRLIRINPGDLNYMVFSAINLTNQGQPIGTDGTYLFITTNTGVYKIDGSLLLDTFAAYGYDGTAPVAIPPVAILNNCSIIQKHPTVAAYSHSIQIDDRFIYLAITTSSNFNGYDATLDMYIYHFQKIDKITMQTVGDVTIPKCTDDIVQNGEYVFLSPEYANADPDLYGSSWGLLAINKNTLEIKYLKALHADFNTINETDRQTYGIQYFGDYMAVQLVSSKKTIIINTSQVNEWGESFPIGGATEAIFAFQIDGVDIAFPTNEMVMDNNNDLHVTLWSSQTVFMKFSIASTGVGITKTPNIQTSLLSSSSDNATLGGFVIDEGKSPITAVGFRYGTDPLNLFNDVPVALAYDFQALIENLDPGIYYFQAYGTNTEGTFYGNTVVFTTYNALSLTNTSAAALLEWINENYGCSIRCVQDAPGVADGTTGTATDQDGNEYNTVVINQKRWFVENLKTTHYRNGDAIPEVTDDATWAALNSGGQSVYDNDLKNL